MDHSLPSPRELKEEYPTRSTDSTTIAHWRQDIINILHGDDRRYLLIIGPCAIHRTDATLEYAKKLSQLAYDTKDIFLIVMRTYIEKSRTKGGWKGFLHTPEGGFAASRRLLLDITRLGLPAAMELVSPFSSPYFDDLISWGALGARTVTSSVHHELASSLTMPIGIKNSLDGSFENAVHAMVAARKSHQSLSLGMDGRIGLNTTSGNPYVHLVLRGGASGHNCGTEHIRDASSMLRRTGLCDAIVVDCSHGNSQKQWERQPEILQTALRNTLENSLPVKGFMIESFLLDGTQETLLQNAAEHHREAITYGASVMDGCLGWDKTADLVLSAYTKLKRNKEYT